MRDARRHDSDFVGARFPRGVTATGSGQHCARLLLMLLLLLLRRLTASITVADADGRLGFLLSAPIELSVDALMADGPHLLGPGTPSVRIADKQLRSAVVRDCAAEAVAIVRGSALLTAANLQQHRDCEAERGESACYFHRLFVYE